MNLLRTPRAASLALAAGCLVVAGWPTNVHAQAPTPRPRPAARSKVPAAASRAPAAAPTATPTPAPVANPEAKPTAEINAPANEPPDKPEETRTDIVATQSASFNSKDRIAVFTGNVKVKDPRFELACDELTVYLTKSAPTGPTPAPANGTPPPSNTPAPGAQPSPTPAGGGGIDHAVATGHVIIVQRKAATKPGEEDKLSIGRGGIGTFDNKSGDMVLKDWPSLEQNGSSLVATAQGTVMTIHRDSSMNTDGPSITKLIQHGKGGTLDIPTAPAPPSSGNKPKAVNASVPSAQGNRRPQPTPASN